MGTSDLRLLMLGAMYENGGNVTHRFLDGHPELFVYPFESQLGTRHVVDRLSSLFPIKYRWPVFDLAASPAQDYAAIIDEEGKVRARTPHVSKFRHMPFDFSDEDRQRIYEGIIARVGRSRPNNVAAFFQATFEAWKDCKRTGREKYYVGYSPILVVDADKILGEMPQAHFLHVVRNPWSAYADTKKRPVPHSLADYMTGWVLNQEYALRIQKKFPDRFHLLRTEDTLQDPLKILGGLCEKLGIQPDPILKTTTWNGEKLAEVYPWGTIRQATPEANRATAAELSARERDEIREWTRFLLETLDYKNFI
jgi:hypothetical protein